MSIASLAERIPVRVGFRMHESMRGWHVFEPGWGPPGRHPFRFDVTWGPDDLGRWLDPRSPDFLRHPMRGTVTVGGLCAQVPCEGTMELRYVGEHRIGYRFRFEAGGRTFLFRGDKVEIRPWNLPFSHTTCFGTIQIDDDEGGSQLVSRSVTRFLLRTTPAFVGSFRVRLTRRTTPGTSRASG